MSERQKLPKYIVVLNIIMIVLLLAICGLIFTLAMSAKNLGWDLPTPDGAGVSESAAAGTGSGSAEADGSAEITVQAPSAE